MSSLIQLLQISAVLHVSLRFYIISIAEDVVHTSPSLEANLVIASQSDLPDDDDEDLPGDPSDVTFCTDEVRIALSNSDTVIWGSINQNV